MACLGKNAPSVQGAIMCTLCELDLCSFCEHERRKLDGAHVSDDLAKEFNLLKKKKKTKGDTSVKCIPSNN